ncbi:MAG: hypothetical protein AMXMBFR64_35320 [Myxococcales bacterium]
MSTLSRSSGAGEAGGGLSPALRRLLLGVLLASFVTALGVYHVWYQHRTRELGKQLSAETERHTELLEQQKRLKRDLSALKRQVDVRREASERLSMRITTQSDYIVVTD